MNYSKSKRLRGYPKVITDFPEADIQVKGIKAWVAQGEKHQIVFFEMEPSAIVPEHWHDYAQWGLMIDGEMELTIDGKTQVCRKGDEYVIPAHARHHARFRRRSRVMDLFSEKTRYRTQSS
ncbi:MAG TPA: cupin domain-containing protein [Candidatus Bathyarchaeia archaeon]|nr:cupin domain-containing protein [Candidatus Bathyarchaeia archaeon]